MMSSARDRDIQSPVMDAYVMLLKVRAVKYASAGMLVHPRKKYFICYSYARKLSIENNDELAIYFRLGEFRKQNGLFLTNL